MAHGGARPGAGRKPGVKIVPQFRDYVSEKDRAAFVKHILTAYKKNPKIATWMGDQLFGKAAQPLTGPDGGPIEIKGVTISVRK